VVFDVGASSFNKGITIQAQGGVVLSESFTTKSTNTFIQSGTGTLTIVSTKSLVTTNELLVITADDFDLQGAASVDSGLKTAGGKLITLLTYTPSREIGLGATSGSTVKPLQISDSEMGCFISNGLSIGDSSSGNITVDGVTDTNSDTFSTLMLHATKAPSVVLFDNSATSFNKGIVVQAVGGVILSESVTTKSTGTRILTGTGTLTIVASKTLTTTNEMLTVTADDIDFSASAAMSSGTSYIHIQPTSPRTIGLGTTVMGMDIEGSEVGALYGAGITVGCAGVNKSVRIAGITLANSSGVTGVVSILSTVDDSTITFSDASSTFHSLVAQVDNGIMVAAHVTTTAGALYLDGDLENSSSSDSGSTITFSHGRVVSSRTLLTLEATTGTSMITQGDLTLNAGSGIMIHESITSSVSSGPRSLVFSADYVAPKGDGILTLAAGKTIHSNNGSVTMTAFDLDLAGGIAAGTAAVKATQSLNDQETTFGFGTGSFAFDVYEVQRVTSGGLVVGGPISALITTTGLTAANTNAIAGIVTVMASRDNAKVVFGSSASTFYGLAAQADNGVVLEVDLTASLGVMTLDGDMDDSNTDDNDNQLLLKGARTLSSTGLMTLDSTTGGIVRSGMSTLRLHGKAGITVNDNLSQTLSGHPVVINADHDASGEGVFTVASGKKLETNNGVLTITASDIQLGALDSGTSTIYMHVSKDTMTMGLGLTTKDLTISGAELANVKASGLNFGNTMNGSILVDGVSSGGEIAGIASVLATGHTRQVVFTNTKSTFNALSVQADNGITVNTDITTILGRLLLDGDYDNSPVGDRKDRIVIAGSKILTASEQLILDSTSGGIFYLGALTLQGREGVVINDDMVGTTGMLRINADTDSSAVGSFTIAPSKLVDSVNSDIEITAADVDLSGSLNAGTRAISVHAANTAAGITIGIGSTPKDMTLSDSEIGRITCNAGLTIGDQHNSHITVDAVLDSNSDGIGRFTLIASKAAKMVSFSTTASSFNKGITVQAAAGVVLSESVTTKQSTCNLRAGTGTLTIVSTKSLSSSGQLLLVTADDIDLHGDAIVSSGTAATTIATETARTIGVGILTEQMKISTSELQGILATGLTIGCAGVNKSMRVSGITAGSSNGISEIVTLLATVDDSQITFNNAASTFNAMSAQADNGLLISREITTTTGALYLDGDVEDDAAADLDNRVNFLTDGLSFSAKTVMTLEATLGSIRAAGALTLQAGTGIVILNSIAITATGKSLTIAADYESGGDGTLTIGAGKTLVTNNGLLTVTAADVDFSGSVDSGTALTRMHTATVGGTMGLGATVTGFTLDSSEIGAIKSTGFILGNMINSHIKVSGVASASKISGTLTLVAMRDDAQIIFHDGASTFNSLAVQADNGIKVEATFTSIAGPMTLDGDTDNSSTGDDHNAIATYGPATIRSTGQLTLNSLSGGITRGGIGTLTLQSGEGVLLNNKVVSATAGQSMVIYADDTGTGMGVFTMKDGNVITTNDGAVTITASDLDLLGGINANTGAVSLTVSKQSLTMGLGGAAGQFSFTGMEMQRITSGGLSIGGALNGSITVTGLTGPHSEKITGSITLLATGQLAEVNFKALPSTFSALSAMADNGIDVEQDLITTLGSLTLNGDMDKYDEGKARDYISFTANRTLISAADMTLTAKSGGIKVAGALTLVAKGSVFIEEYFTGPFGNHTVTITPDSDTDQVGVLDISPNACSVYTDCASCSASRLCGWCGSTPKTVGNGVVSTQGLTAQTMIGHGTAFVSDAGITPGTLINVDGQSRVVASVVNDTALNLDTAFTRIATGFVTVYEAGGRDKLVGTRPTIFTTELEAGYTVTAGGHTRTVAAVSSYKIFTTTTAWPTAGTNQLFTIGLVPGRGVVSTEAGTSVTVTGSWPSQQPLLPAGTRFLSQVAVGTTIMVGGITRTVASVLSNQLLTVTTPFDTKFTAMAFTVSGVQGSGAISFASGSTETSGIDMMATRFTQELYVGDLITLFGQTKMVQTITDDQHLSVGGFFTTPFDTQQLQVGTIHSKSFTVAQRGTGTVHVAGTVVTGIFTIFAEELTVGYRLFLKFGTEYQNRTIASIQHNTQLTLSSAFSANLTLAQAAQFHTCSCPTHQAETDESVAGTFALHAKAERPGTCFSTGRCVPRSSHSTIFQTVHTGTVTGGTAVTTVTGSGSNFLSEVKPGQTISVYSSTYQESRRVVSVTSNMVLVIDKPWSFTLPSSANQNYIVRGVTGGGLLTNDGIGTSVLGAGTRFLRDLVVGWLIAVGNQKRVVTSVVNDSLITISAPFNAGQGGITQSAWALESCASGGTFPVRTYNTESCELKPGCCGFKVTGQVGAGNFAYYKITPVHSSQDLRLVLSSTSNQIDLLVRRGAGPDNVFYDFKSPRSASPWVLNIPHDAIRCAATTCTPIWVGIWGLPTAGTIAAYELSSYFEMNFATFACSESSATSASAKCNATGLLQLGHATFDNDLRDENNAVVMRLTPELPTQSGAVWWQRKVHIENGFETSFRFKISSACIESDVTECDTGDGFAFVLYGGESLSTAAGCGGRALGFASDLGKNCTSGIPYSFAVEFDTWHNPELHDINVRGAGTDMMNASEISRHSFAHVAFFSQGARPNSAIHTDQIAGTPAIPRITDGKVHQARLVYIPGAPTTTGRIFLYIDDMQSFVLTAPIRLGRQSSYCSSTSRTDRCILDPYGNAHIGFTSSTGNAAQTHDIRDWVFCDEPNCGRTA
jgi:hypothetical protein